MIDRITVLHFSPTGGTRRAAQLLAARIAQQVEEIDLALPQAQTHGFGPEDVVLVAGSVYGGRLPIHVRCLIDEAANIGQIPRLEKLVATIRSREVSACLVLQAQSQLKALYRDHADTIVGNMDARLFLGGSEPTTLKELSAALGKETIDTYNTGESRGRETSHSLNYQKLGKDVP